jgi:heat shock protein HtpX
MARTKIEVDHGLTFRMLLVGLGLVLLYAILGGVALRMGVGMPLVIGFGAVLLAAQYYFSGPIAMFSMRAHEVTPEEEPRLHQIIDRLCLMADMPKPKVGIAEMDIPNAFATGRNPKAAVVCATRGIMTRLDDEQLEAVLAHELSHVAHRDVAVMTIASGVGMLAGLVSRMAMWGAMFSGGGNDRNNNSAAGEMVAWLVSIVIYFIAFILTMALSRYRELSADRSGAILIGKPSALASALVTITGDMGRIPRTDLRRAENGNAFFFVPALAGGTGATLFSTHPSLQVRLDALNKLERELNG